MALYKTKEADILRITLRISDPEITSFFKAQVFVNRSEFIRKSILEVIKSGVWKKWK